MNETPLRFVDACYVALAEREGIPLLTADKELVNKLANSPFQIQSLDLLAMPGVPARP